METINKMIELAMEQYRAEFGQDAKIEDGYDKELDVKFEILAR